MEKTAFMKNIMFIYDAGFKVGPMRRRALFKVGPA